MVAEITVIEPADRQVGVEVPVIDGLSPALVPHRQWAFRKWFCASPLWFYHRAGSNGDLNANRAFYALVDEHLRPLCRILHEAGLHTTPSCQGHFYPREHFENVWRELEAEEAIIPKAGLLVKDSETDERCLFRDSSYALPWPNPEAFFAEAKSHQSVGYLGVVIRLDRPGLRSRLERDDYRTLRTTTSFEERSPQGGGLYHILVEPRTPSERSAEWAEVTLYLEALLTNKNR